MKYRLIILILVLIANFACNSSIEKKIARQAGKCENENCTIKINALTDFKWDKMYAFNYEVSPEVIDEAIGFKYDKYDYEEFKRPWIFVKNNKIVYSENNPYDIESVVDGEVVFNCPDSLTYMVYTSKTAIFKVKQETSNNNNYYLLY